jgi:chromosomal replication initiation ATPase DnaA
MDRCPVCGDRQKQQYLERICGLAPEMYGWTFESTSPANEQQIAPWEYMRSLSVSPAWCVTLTGRFGSGKTRLLACLVNAGRSAGWTSVYASMSEILEHLRRGYRPEAEMGYDELWERLVDARILAIDECDRWNPTPWAQEKFFDLIDARYRAGADHCTAFATNKQVDELPGYLASRLRDKRGRVFDFGPDAADMRQM